MDLRRLPRDNPPGRRHFKAEVFAFRNPNLLDRVGAHRSRRFLGCGANGCAIEAKSRASVVKVTMDPTELALVQAIARIRRRPVPKVSAKKRLALARIGTTPREVRSLPGFVMLRGSPICSGRKWCVYQRERLSPLDADRSKRGKALARKVEKGIDGFFYERRWKDPIDFLSLYPELRTITRTILGLLWVYGITTEDIHEQQVGRVIYGRGNRKKGTLVLYDGQVYGRLPRTLTRNNPDCDCGCPRLINA